MTIPLILLSILGAWWLLLTVWVIRSYFERVQDAKTPMTPEQLEQFRQLEERTPQKRMRGRDYFIAGPFIIAFVLFLLPCYLYTWFLKHRDPYDRPHRSMP